MCAWYNQHKLACKANLSVGLESRTMPSPFRLDNWVGCARLGGEKGSCFMLELQQQYSSEIFTEKTPAIFGQFQFLQYMCRGTHYGPGAHTPGSR